MTAPEPRSSRPPAPHSRSCDGGGRPAKSGLRLRRTATRLIAQLVPEIVRNPWLLPVGRSAQRTEEISAALSEMQSFVTVTRSLAEYAEDKEAQMKDELWRTLLDAYAVAKVSGNNPAAQRLVSTR